MAGLCLAIELQKCVLRMRNCRYSERESPAVGSVRLIIGLSSWLRRLMKFQLLHLLELSPSIILPAGLCISSSELVMGVGFRRPIFSRRLQFGDRRFDVASLKQQFAEAIVCFSVVGLLPDR